MNKLQKLTFTFTFIATSIGVVYSSPCYTNTEDGCGNNDEKIIHVETKDTNFGFCTEYLNNNNKKIIRCHSNLSEEDEKLIAQKKVMATTPEPKETTNTSIHNYYFNYTIPSDSNQKNNNNNTGYSYGYNYLNQYYPSYYDNNHYRPRPPNHKHDNWRPPHKNQNVILPSMPVGKNNNKVTPAKPNNTHQPPSHGSGSHHSPRVAIPLSIKR